VSFVLGGFPVQLLDAREVAKRCRADDHAALTRERPPRAPGTTGARANRRSSPDGSRDRCAGPGQRPPGYRRTGDNLGIGAGLLDERRPDEHRAEWRHPERCDRDVRLERLHLTSVAVASDADVKNSQRDLIGRPSSTSRLNRMRPAHVERVGMPPARRSRSGISRSNTWRRRLIVVDSPPGRISASTRSSSSGVRTVDASAPQPRTASRCSWTSPWRARTPTRRMVNSLSADANAPSLAGRLRVIRTPLVYAAGRAASASPTAGCEQLPAASRRRRARHGLAQTCAHFSDDLGLVEIRRRGDDRLGNMPRDRCS